MVVKEKILRNVCLTAHPKGCREYVENEIDFVEKSMKGSDERYPKLDTKPMNVLILGCSTGYGLSSRIVTGIGMKAKTLGVCFERTPSSKPATPGWYNTKVFEEEAEKRGIYAKTINGDAFSDEVKKEVCETIKRDLGKVDLVIYSLASPVRTDPKTGITYKSVLKPIGNSFTELSVNSKTGILEKATFTAATEEQAKATVKVMGGEDWKLWMETLLENDVVSDGFKSVAYSYIGPKITYPIYREGTIGKAKEDLESSVEEINALISKKGGEAYISVNKALVTRASAVIPVVPLYTAILYKVMEDKGIHENCIEQMYRLYSSKLPSKSTDEKGRIRLDDWEMREDVQKEVEDIWKTLKEGEELVQGDLEMFRTDYSHLHGFGYKNIDYSKDVDLERP
ncbi:MAG: enoyl-ACP reductase FabV [Sphaerochaetaceae bacterium]|jgi:enoyl-[acyl-carrier protein] reductase/trans-2-enoyl-CoA reductase (NAD+)